LISLTLRAMLSSVTTSVMIHIISRLTKSPNLKTKYEYFLGYKDSSFCNRCKYVLLQID
jgi:hypothetical protein